MVHGGPYPLLITQTPRPMRQALLTPFLAAVFAFSPTSSAQQFDVEIDPIAYVMNGYSVHLGYLWGSFRLDVGVFGIEVPAAVHGNDGFANRIDGAGVKLDYYVSEPGSGLFAGIEGGIVRSTVEWTETGDGTHRAQYSVGARTGYRFLIGHRFTVTPWVGLGYTLNARDQQVGGHAFETGAFQPFPTVHLGYSF